MALFPLSNLLDGTKKLFTQTVKTSTLTGTLQGAATATGNGTPLSTDGYGVALLQITGTFVGTIVFEGSVDNTNFVALFGRNRNTNVSAASATAPGIFELDVRGLQTLRARISAYTSGSITVAGRAEPFSGTPAINDVALTGRNVVKVFNDTLNLSAGGVGTLTFTPPAGKIWTDIALSVYWRTAVSATGSVVLDVYRGTTIDEFHRILKMTSGANSTRQEFRFRPSALVFGTITNPSEITTITALNEHLRSFSFSNALPITLVLTNSTDVSASGSGSKEIYLFYREE
jgi:hypothetical protein